MVLRQRVIPSAPTAVLQTRTGRLLRPGERSSSSGKGGSRGCGGSRFPDYSTSTQFPTPYLNAPLILNRRLFLNLGVLSKLHWEGHYILGGVGGQTPGDKMGHKDVMYKGQI